MLGEIARRWGPAVAVMAAIFAFSAQAGHDLPDLGAFDLLGKKGGHLAGYALLGAAYLRGLAWGRVASRRHAAAAVALAVLYAATDEWHQGFVAGRTPSALDVAIDGSGALLGASLALALRRRRAAG